MVDVDTPGMKTLIEAYERYKNQFQDEIIYPPTLMSTTFIPYFNVLKNCFQTTNLKAGFTM